MADGSSKPISEIVVGDEVLAPDPVAGDTGAKVGVVGLDWGSLSSGAAFDLTVKGLHSFYVDTGVQDVLVHNTNCGGGTTRVANDPRSIRVADRAPVAAGEHNVVPHGDSNGFIGVSADEVASSVRSDPAYGGQRICLLPCHSASNGSAQALAADLGVPVRAPTDRVGLPGPPAPPVTTLDIGSEWQWFYPWGP